MSTAVEPQLRPLSYFARQIPGDQGATHCNPATVGRWVRRGCKLRNGAVVKLKAVRIGRKWLSRDDWFKQFCDDLAAPYQDNTTPVRTPAQRRKDDEAAAREVQRLGVPA